MKGSGGLGGCGGWGEEGAVGKGKSVRPNCLNNDAKLLPEFLGCMLFQDLRAVREQVTGSDGPKNLPLRYTPQALLLQALVEEHCVPLQEAPKSLLHLNGADIVRGHQTSFGIRVPVQKSKPQVLT